MLSVTSIAFLTQFCIYAILYTADIIVTYYVSLMLKIHICLKKKDYNTNVNGEVIVVGNSEVSQLSEVHIPSSNRIQNEDIRWETKSSPLSSDRHSTWKIQQTFYSFKRIKTVVYKEKYSCL